MKTKTLKCTNGEEFTYLIPETEEEVAELERLEAEGKLDANHSFADLHNRRAEARSASRS